MIARRHALPAALTALVAVAVPAAARADWVQHQSASPGYCADSRDYTSTVSNHITLGGTLTTADGYSWTPLFFAGCSERSDGNADINFQFGPSTSPIQSTGGALENLSATSNANLWGSASAESDSSLWFAQHYDAWWAPGTTYYQWSRRTAPPGGASSIAAVNDTTLYAVGGTYCAGADMCVYFTSDSGATWNPVGARSFGGSQAAAVEVSFDSATGTSWLRTANGHVLRSTRHRSFITWFSYDDVGVQGLPTIAGPGTASVGATRLAVGGGYAYVISNDQKNNVYMLAPWSTTWTQLGSIERATDIAVAPSGIPWVVIDDGIASTTPDANTHSNNIYQYLNIP